MIRGLVNRDREAIVVVAVQGPLGDRISIDGLVDTGFDGWISLPSRIITLLKLPWRRRGRAELADGSEHVFDIHEATVEWDGQLRRVPVDAVESIPMLGMALLHNQELRIEVQPGGTVVIERLP
jgi:clan AA aspartic protease